MACYNRRDQTVACLKALQHNRMTAAASFELFVTDDNSTDGTPAAVLAFWPTANIIRGTGSLYWASSMALAERAALHTDPDYLLWLNDDTFLDPDAIQRMVDVAEAHAPCIVVGATRDPDSNEFTYGGRLRHGRHPLRLDPLGWVDTPVAVDTFNGNCVLVHREVSRRIGPIDGLYAHAYADDDYSYRAHDAGISAIQTPGSIGVCAHNPPSSGLGLRAAWRMMRSPKGMPWRSQTRFLRRHAGYEWPLLLIWGQIRYLLRTAKV